MSQEKKGHSTATTHLHAPLIDTGHSLPIFLLCCVANLAIPRVKNMNNKVVIVDEKFCFPEETHLTVHKTSVFFPGDGFIVYDLHGEVLYRFDSYGPESKPKDELVLMDSSGKCLLTLLRKVGYYSPLFRFVCLIGFLS